MDVDVARLVLAGDVLLGPVLEEHPGDGGALGGTGGWMPTLQPNIGDRFVEVNWLVGGDWLTLDLTGAHADGDGAEWVVEVTHNDRRDARGHTKHEVVGWGAIDQPLPAEVVERMRNWLVAHALPQPTVFVSRWPALVADARRSINTAAADDGSTAHDRRWVRVRRQREETR